MPGPGSVRVAGPPGPRAAIDRRPPDQAAYPAADVHQTVTRRCGPGRLQSRKDSLSWSPSPATIPNSPAGHARLSRSRRSRPRPSGNADSPLRLLVDGPRLADASAMCRRPPPGWMGGLHSCPRTRQSYRPAVCPRRTRPRLRVDHGQGRGDPSTRPRSRSEFAADATRPPPSAERPWPSLSATWDRQRAARRCTPSSMVVCQPRSREVVVGRSSTPRGSRPPCFRSRGAATVVSGRAYPRRSLRIARRGSPAEAAQGNGAGGGRRTRSSPGRAVSSARVRAHAGPTAVFDVWPAPAAASRPKTVKRHTDAHFREGHLRR